MCLNKFDHFGTWEGVEMKNLMWVFVVVLMAWSSTAFAAVTGTAAARDVIVDTALMGAQATAGDEGLSASFGNGLTDLVPNDNLEGGIIDDIGDVCTRDLNWIRANHGQLTTEGTFVNGFWMTAARQNGGCLPDSFPDVINDTTQ